MWFEFGVGRGSKLPGVFPEVFDRRDYASNSILGLDVAAFEELQRLSLKIAQRGYGAIPNSVENIRGLPKLLTSTKWLQRLDLGLPLDPDSYPSIYRYDEIFPKHTEWKSLETGTKWNSQWCRTPQLISVPDAGPQNSRTWRSRAQGRYLGSCHRAS